jgi:hypothetical protein
MPVADKPRSKPPSKLSKSLQGRVGKWVAIRGDKVVATATTLNALREQVEGEQIDGFLRVPPKRRGGVFL